MGDLARDGFAVLHGFLDTAAVRAIRAKVDSLVRVPAPAGCERPHNTLWPLRWSDAIVEMALSNSRRRAALAHALRARDLRWISAYVSSKDARSPALWWHQDWWCWEHPVTWRRAAAQVAVLCYLSTTDERNGALRVLPGSHLRSLPLHAVLPEAHSDAAEGVAPDHPAMRSAAGEVTLRVRAGDAVALDYRLLHGTHPNASQVRRDCVVLSFAPSWSDLPADVRAHLICHPAQPARDEVAGLPWQAGLLPRFDGTRRDLRLSRDAPARFAIPDGNDVAGAAMDTRG